MEPLNKKELNKPKFKKLLLGAGDVVFLTVIYLMDHLQINQIKVELRYI